MLVRGRKLVDQASQRLIREGVPHGVLMAGHWNYRPQELIQVCSIDTVSRRMDAIKNADLIVVDECLTPDMELLTDKGFIRFDVLNKTELVAQFDQDNMEISFCEPIRWVEKQVENINLITIKQDKRIDISMTENHEVLLCDKNKTKKLTAGSFNFSYYSMFKAGYATGDDDLLSPYEKLMIAYQADGSDHSLYKAYFTFSRERKIKKFLDLMNEGGFEYKEISGQDSRLNAKAKRRFSVRIESRSKFVDDIFDIKKLSSGKCRAIIEYMVNWDGSIINENTYYFSSAYKRNADFYQAIACLCGYYTNLIIQHDNRSETFSSIFRLFITKNRNKITLQNLKKEYSKYTGKVYCVTVPKGNIIVRRNGKTLVVGNCHMAAAQSFKKFLEQFPDAYKLGVTATPYQRATITHIAEHVVNPITMTELIDQGYLVPAKYYAPSHPDLTGVKIKSSTGDYDEEQLEARCNQIIGDLATNWKRFGENRPTICFAINISHSKNIVTHLTAHGIRAAHIDADSSDEERNDVIHKLQVGELQIVSNVGILTTGVDLPFVSCILMARPTLSLNLHIQILGRATRTHENKKDFIVLDHGNNVARHGFITQERPAILEFKKGQSKIIGVPPVATCEECYAVFPVQTKVCPQCGHVNEKADRKIVEVDGELKLLTDEQYEKFKTKIRFMELKRIQKEKGYKRGWVFYKMKDEFGEEIAESFVPLRVVPDWV